MKRLKTALRLLVIGVLINFCQGILIIGPNFVRSGQNYTLIVSNFEASKNELSVIVQLDGTSTTTGEKLLRLRKSVRLQPLANTAINFPLPNNLPHGSYKIAIDGENGFKLHTAADLMHLSNPFTGFIQLNKPIYKPGDAVQFRAIVLDGELKPPAGTDTARITVRDPQGNVIRRWATAKLHVGVFEAALQVATVPLVGRYTITVHVGPHAVAYKTFEVQEYALALFDVELRPNGIPLEKDQRLDLTIFAWYYVGKPVKGVATVSLYLEDDKLDQRKTVNVYGKAQVELRFNEYLHVFEDSQDVRVNVTFTQDETGKSITKEQRIAVYKHQYRVELEKALPEFRAGEPLDCVLRLLYRDGQPARRIAASVTAEGTVADSETVYTSDDAGAIKLTLQPDASAQLIDITVKIDGELLFFETISRRDAGKAFLKLELASEVKLGKSLDLTVTCNEEMAFFLYYVVTKGKIVSSGFIQPNAVTPYTLRIASTDDMMPRSKIFVATVVKNVVLYDVLEADFQDLLNNFDLKIDKTKVRPGEELQLNMNGRGGAYVALAAYDKSLLQYGTTHDIVWSDVLEIFSEFYTKRTNDFDFFHSMALFARTMEHIRFEGASENLLRDGWIISRTGVANKLDSFRTNFVESWLWKTTQLGAEGSATMQEIVPDTTTAWLLTGFSVHPVYGLGIIKQPLELATVQKFYIVPHLPYSIKRGEMVELQFIIFSNFPQKHEASITLYNVDNQTEFVGQPADDTSHTKSVLVSSGTGVVVSFPVKARKLGEMTVRVKASIDPATDTIESVVRVIPDSLVKREMVSRFFCHNTYHNQSFTINLDFDLKADPGHKKIDFILTPNILTSVMDNLESLLSVPTGCGEQNMMRLVPIVQVLDYTTSIGSADKRLTEKATGLLKAGYQNQMRFRQPDGSFGLWEKSGGAVFLTAFVGKTLATAAKHIAEIEPDMVMKTYDWLAARQHATGRFDEVGPIFHKDMQGGLRQGIALTSFVLISFLEHPNAATKHAAAIAKGIKYVTGALDNIEDSYDLAIATYALMLQGHTARDRFLEKLIGMSSVQQNGTERYWQRSANGIETTAYALLSFVQAEKYVDGTSIMRWLVKQRYTPGSFPRTQDTFVGLKALTKLAEKISPARNDYSVQLVHSGRQKEFRVNSQDIGKLQHAEGVDDSLQLQINVAGIGFGLLQVAYEYSVDLRNLENSFKLTLKQSLSNAGKRLELEVCSSFIPKLSDGRSNMALVEVNFPSGYTTERERIIDTTRYNPIQKIEIRFGGTSVVVYYNNMGTERNCFKVTAFRRTKVTLKRPAYVLVHDYYDPKLSAITMYQVDDHDVCDVCDGQDCPALCH
ncbi:thioester-containing protein 1 allele S3-like [Anopheles moucheti]|uniref:thioester-containing protein 1 allele S3-like n=1 Tax=Anopheles moucheti TaxID=186751 RepID=UPI0022F14132|nr:thioester-containing protein 1 allele S3-like [Anopheles moucheti]